MLAAIGFPLVNRYWPYRYRNVKPLLQTIFASQVTIAHYHRIYFPHPGFVADGLTLTRQATPGLPPIGSVQELKVEGNWGDLVLFRERVRLVDVDGLHVIIPAAGSRENQADFPSGSTADFAGPTTPVETLHFRNTLLEILHKDGSRASYPIHDLELHGVQSGHPVDFVVDMSNAEPTGRIQARGSFGPLTPSNLGGTPLSGEFVFAPANLGDIGSLHGTLAATGHFSGRLAGIETSATADVPDFSVEEGHPTRLAGSVQCTVDGLNGDVVLHTIELHLGKTTVHAGGAVMGSPKNADLQLEVANGRAEDLLLPFLEDKVPVTGPAWLKLNAHIAPADHDKGFLDRLTVDGDFGTPAERLTKHKVATSLTAFSARAQGAGSTGGQPGDPTTAGADVLSSLVGHVEVRRGVASTQRLTFSVPGATADLKGTYAFESGAVHLTGPLKMDADLSHVVTGFKSVLLKPFAIFFKHKNAGTVIEIAVTGVPHQYKVSQDVLHTK